MNKRSGLRGHALVVLCGLMLAWPVRGQPASPGAQIASAGATGMMPQSGTSGAQIPAGDQGGMMAGSGSSTGGPGHQGQMCPPQCGQMMEKEMRAYPWKVTGVATLGGLVGIAVILLIALEVQWLKLWSHRVRIERSKLAPPDAS